MGLPQRNCLVVARGTSARPIELYPALGEPQIIDWSDAADAGERLARFDDALPHADAILSAPWLMNMPEFTPERWERAERLKVIAGTYDNRFSHWINIPEARRRGVTVIDTSRSMTPTVAEFALAMTLNLLRDIPAAIEIVRRGGWHGPMDRPGFVYGDLTGRRVGLAGYGSINRRYAELLAPFRCAIQVCDPFVPDSALEAGMERASDLAELARRSEIFMVGIPPTPATQGIISKEVIEALPQGSLFILVTRMAVVDQEALWQRADSGAIRAAVDVFLPEPPPPDARFRANPCVLPTPHMAGNTLYCHARCFTTACEDAAAVLEGRPPRYEATVWDADLYDGKLTRIK